tara:strand:- start:218 stop:406 length:189 start_codon:yes stop_codon:yes gene_type:complete
MPLGFLLPEGANDHLGTIPLAFMGFLYDYRFEGQAADGRGILSRLNIEDMKRRTEFRSLRQL